MHFKDASQEKSWFIEHPHVLPGHTRQRDVRDEYADTPAPMTFDAFFAGGSLSSDATG